MPVLAVLLTQGGLGDCGQHAVAHALQQPDITVRAIAKAKEVVGKIDDEDWKPVPFLSEDQLGLPRLQVLEIPFAGADAAESLRSAVRGADAVIACPTARQPGKSEFLGRGEATQSMRNVIAAMQAENVQRLVYVSSIGVDTPPFAWKWYSPLLGVLSRLRTAWRMSMKELKATDSAVRSSGLDYLIVRPMGLGVKEPARGSWLEVPGSDTKTPLALMIAKSDVGLCMLRQALTPSKHSDEVMLGQPAAK